MKKENNDYNNTPNEKKKLGCFPKFLIMLVVVAVLLFIIVSIGTSGENKEESTTMFTTAYSTEYAEPNTTKMVENIVKKARYDASQGISEEQRNEAVEYIYKNYDNYFESNEIMENVMYYGSLLEYAYTEDAKNSSPDSLESIYCNLGMDANQCVKYVYRNVEDVSDQATQSNLSQIKKALEKLGYTV